MPPVCFCNPEHSDITCAIHHITASTFWPLVKCYKLVHSERHTEDAEFSKFLAFVREKRPTAEMISEVLTRCTITAEGVLEEADEDTKILCSHREQVKEYNTQLSRKFFPGIPDDAVPVAASITPAVDPAQLPQALRAWASDANFHSLVAAAPTLRVMLTTAVPGPVSAAVYGAMARIEEVHLGGSTACGVEAITIRFDSDGSMLRLERSEVQTKVLGNIKYTMRTFPLRPCVLVPTPITTNAADEPDLQEWVSKDTRQFTALQEIAVGGRAMITANINLPKGAANGATCIVREIVFNTDSSVKAIIVQMDHNGHMQRVTRSTTNQHHHNCKQ